MHALGLFCDPLAAYTRSSILWVCFDGRQCNVDSTGGGAARRHCPISTSSCPIILRWGVPAGYATSRDHVFTLHGDGATAAWPGSKESRTTKELPAAALQVRP